MDVVRWEMVTGGEGNGTEVLLHESSLGSAGPGPAFSSLSPLLSGGECAAIDQHSAQPPIRRAGEGEKRGREKRAEGDVRFTQAGVQLRLAARNKRAEGVTS